MIDHVSVPVQDLEAATVFYEALLGTIGHQKLDSKPGTCGFGKKYPEFWINLRPELARAPNDGFHVCFRARSIEHVNAFFECALREGGTVDGAPGIRDEYDPRYFAAFIRDLDGNRIEVVTFVTDD